MQAATALKDLSFQQLVAANRAAGRLAEKSTQEQGTGEQETGKEKMMLAGLRLTEEEHAEARAFAKADSRSIQWFAHRMYHIGLAEFKRELAKAEAAATRQ